MVPRSVKLSKKHVKPLVPAAFAIVSTHKSRLGSRDGLWPVLLVGCG
jgi:hypothetical protein